MILFSIVTMRDLIKNYRMIIKGKTQESDTETQPLSSSASSSSHSFGTMREPTVFKHENYSTESEEESVARLKKVKSPYSIQDYMKRRALLSPNFSKHEVDEFPNREETDLFSKIESNDTLLSIEKDFVADHSYQYFLGCKDEEEQPTHNSLVTIFAVWNTTMGSSLLAMAWGIEKSGLFCAILINILVAALCLYTAYVLLNVNQKHGMLGQHLEVPDLCRILIGRWAEILAKIFSLVVLTGANIVYWILMSNFLYNFVLFMYGFLIENDSPDDATAVICPKEMVLNIENATVFTQNISFLPISLDFHKVWDLYSTVPVFLAIIMFPLLNFRSPTFFTKFNSLGTVSVCYLMFFVSIKASRWGINIQDWTSELYLKPTFCALSGMLSLSYFIHNIVISIMRNSKYQEHNGRNLSIAFGLITFTYLFIGVVFYISFPLAKTCIEDNILNNFSKRDAMTVITRLLLLFQLFTVFPLISFMMRNDVLTTFSMISKNCPLRKCPYGKVILINLAILFICIMFACFLPRIGTLIRYTGAISGLIYIFVLPSLLKIASLKKEKSLNITKIHCPCFNNCSWGTKSYFPVLY